MRHISTSTSGSSCSSTCSVLEWFCKSRKGKGRKEKIKMRRKKSNKESVKKGDKIRLEFGDRVDFSTGKACKCFTKRWCTYLHAAWMNTCQIQIQYKLVFRKKKNIANKQYKKQFKWTNSLIQVNWISTTTQPWGIMRKLTNYDTSRLENISISQLKNKECLAEMTKAQVGHIQVTQAIFVSNFSI